MNHLSAILRTSLPELASLSSAMPQRQLGQPVGVRWARVGPEQGHGFVLLVEHCSPHGGTQLAAQLPLDGTEQLQVVPALLSVDFMVAQQLHTLSFSPAEFSLFARALDTVHRQRRARNLLRKRQALGLAVPDVEAALATPATPARPPRKRCAATSAQVDRRQGAAASRSSATPSSTRRRLDVDSRRAGRDSSAVPEQCCLCDRGSQAGKAKVHMYTHPYVPLDSRGHPVVCCEECLVEVQAKRMAADGAHAPDAAAAPLLCALCGASGDEPRSKRTAQLHQCHGPHEPAEASCSRALCTTCLPRVVLASPSAASTAPLRCPSCLLASSEQLRRTTVAAVFRPDGSGQAPSQEQLRAEWARACSSAEADSPAPKPPTSPTSVTAAPPLPPPQSAVVHAGEGAAVGYHSAYVCQMELERLDPGAVDSTTTEDCCFLCKDGGDVIECDVGSLCSANGKPLKRPTGHPRADRKRLRRHPRCRKVYHDYCLGQRVPDDGVWVCPCHACTLCGSRSDVTQCRYCPVAYCAKHVTSHAQGTVETIGPNGRPANKAARRDSIICGACVKLVVRADQRGDFGRLLGRDSADGAATVPSDIVTFMRTFPPEVWKPVSAVVSQCKKAIAREAPSSAAAVS